MVEDKKNRWRDRQKWDIKVDRLSYHLDTDHYPGPYTISLRLQSDRDISLEGIQYVIYLSRRWAAPI